MPDAPARSLAESVVLYYEELKAFIQRRTGSQALAADVVQDLWLKAATAAPASGPVGNPRAYLYRMAGNLLIDQHRRDLAQASHLAEEEPQADLPSPDPGPERVAAARQELAILAEAVRGLPDRCREVFLLYRGEGLSMRQIAQRLDISESTVEKHIARAMVQCRNRLSAQGEG